MIKRVITIAIHYNTKCNKQINKIKRFLFLSNFKHIQYEKFDTIFRKYYIVEFFVNTRKESNIITKFKESLKY